MYDKAFNTGEVKPKTQTRKPEKKKNNNKIILHFKTELNYLNFVLGIEFWKKKKKINFLVEIHSSYYKMNTIICVQKRGIFKIFIFFLDKFIVTSDSI